MPSNLAALALAAAGSTVVLAAPAADKVDRLPGFEPTSFNVYSGFLKVAGPFKQNDYDSLSIHYQFQASQNDPKNDPIATWHQGGPGGSSIDVGLCECPRTLVPHCVFSCRP